MEPLAGDSVSSRRVATSITQRHRILINLRYFSQDGHLAQIRYDQSPIVLVDKHVSTFAADVMGWDRRNYFAAIIAAIIDVIVSWDVSGRSVVCSNKFVGVFGHFILTR